MGMMPPTKLLLVHYDVVIGEFNNYFEIANHFGISIDDDGQVTFNNRLVNPTYLVKNKEDTGNNRFDKLDAIRDWAKCHMTNNLPAKTKIYRYLK